MRSLLGGLLLLSLAGSAQAAEEATGRWSGGGEAKALPRQRTAPNDLAERRSPRRPPVRAIAMIDAASLPVVTTTPRPWPSGNDPRPVPLPPSVSDTPELRLLERSQVTFVGERLGYIHHRFFPHDQIRPRRAAQVAAGGATVECAGTSVDMGWNGEGPRVDPIHWRAVSLEGDGLRVEEGNGWFDGFGCRVVTLHRKEVVARPIGNRIYAFIQRCPTCKAGERERLRVFHTTLREDWAAAVSPLSMDRAHWQLESMSLALEPGSTSRASLTVFEEKTSFDTIGASDRFVVETKRGSEGPARILTYLQREPRSAF